MAASDDCIKIIGLDGSLQYMSEGGQRVMEVDDFATIKGCPWPDFWQGQGNADAIAAIVEARAGRTGRFTGFANTAKGNRRFWDVKVSPIVGGDGSISSLLSVSRDITAIKQLEDQQAVLNNELSHRMKNMMTLVQALADQTLREVPERGPIENLTKRLQALASAHDLLLGQNWREARVMAAVTSTLEAFGHIERFEADGPEVMLAPQAVVSLSLLLHELATNALKYGALSNEAGRVTLTWEIADQEGEPTFLLHWCETGGPPVIEPARKGFGSRLIRAGLIGMGGVDLRYLPSGLEADMSARLAHMQQA